MPSEKSSQQLIRLTGESGKVKLQIGVHYQPTFAKKALGERTE